MGRLGGLVLLALLSLLAADPAAARPRPHILVVTVDTLRADHLSGAGYSRPTSPRIDRLMAAGRSFTEARTVQPVTGPSMVSLWTSLHPHEHGASRNALAMAPGLPSVSGRLGARGWRTAAFVSNWVLKDQLCGLGEHFDHYQGVFTRKQWWVLRDEARAEDVTEAALDWLDEQREEEPLRPVLLWAHYTEPHGPYVFHDEYAHRLGIDRRRPGKIDRYDTEIAAVDAAVGDLVDGVERVVDGEDLLVVFTADHGESLGEHGLWGHGRHLYDDTLRIPLSYTWEGEITPGEIGALASLLDVAPTLLGLLGLPVPEGFRGHDWSGVLLDGAPEPAGRTTYHQAHKGPVHFNRDSQEPRRKGLVGVALVEPGRKEILRVGGGRHRVFDLLEDPGETRDLSVGAADEDAAPSKELLEWMGSVYEGLDALERLPVEVFDEESVERLRNLGYID